MSGAWDVNRDGFDDVIIGAPAVNPNRVNSGKSYVVYRMADGFLAELELASLNGDKGFTLNGISRAPWYDDPSGKFVSGAGDVNGDGLDDLIIGAPHADPNGHCTGQSYVVFSTADGFAAKLVRASLDGNNGFSMDIRVSSVSGAGDFNRDGFNDVIIGAPRASPSGIYTGQSYVVFGAAKGFPAELKPRPR